MNARIVCGWHVLGVALAAGCSQQGATVSEAEVAATGARPEAAAAADEAGAPARPKIYDESADGFEQIAAALKTAKASDKRVLLQFGAEWCGWCHRLHRLFETDERIAQALAAGFAVVLIDVDGDHNSAVNEQYGNPTQHGLPVIVILDAEGKQLTTQDTAELEEGDHHDPAKVMAFLEEWAPRAGEADGVASTSDAPVVTQY